jgi:hypothetical protein
MKNKYEIIEQGDGECEEEPVKVRGVLELTEEEADNFSDFLGHSPHLGIREVTKERPTLAFNQLSEREHSRR